ncbi:hypothetical protein [Roseateles violae]|uniref:Uncharacterized protein n=1 Tax=Roseateles violae TaxID=3058042 RepID=A0ABT8DTP5_9BURK|nr:hypothetical protein [Pelomonas sp. PFR6]MDN3920400.1 hypothetical protein [Pelomonas sp. PFR6]
MTDLSHWNFAARFTAREAAALILGYEPDDAWKPNAGVSHRLSVVYERMRHDFDEVVRNCRRMREARKPGNFDIPAFLSAGLLISESLYAELKRPITAAQDNFMPIRHVEFAKFDTQVFKRKAIQIWVRNNKMDSAYDFSSPAERDLTRTEAAQAIEIDPADLPDELHAANIAFRAVTNGHGDPEATFKNRLMQYLRANFDFSDEAVQRIATVANPDKSAGRRKRAA